MRTPSGIDRVELEYAKFTASAGGVFVAQISNRLAIVPTHLASAAIDGLSKSWTSDQSNQSSLSSLIKVWKDQASSKQIYQLLSYFKLLFQGRCAPSLELKWLHDFPHADNDWYLNVGHTGIDNSGLFTYIRSNTKLRIALYIHDVLPLTHPELFVEKEYSRHEARVLNARQFSDKIFVNSFYTASQLSLRVGDLQPKVIEIGTFVHGGMSNEERRPIRRDFVSIGTIEPRKNYLWLVEQWLIFCEKNSNFVTNEKLRIFGRVGWMDEDEFSHLAHMARKMDKLEIVTDATDFEIANALLNSRAYISASKVEGWGMPLAESLAVGTPVIASDIDAHREVTQGLAQYFSCSVPSQLHEALSACFDAEVYENCLTRTKQFEPWSWATHFATLQSELCKSSW
ncbi:glycosyltransferase [Agrobacterium sp. rho-13.3]|uniref:glycosyltransferase n=1 Tax=Agrobacterium sp. rho-13.3 TaxID=3072980 RepID=UPI002A13939E|nr:glycosyltransferase [Agrobacterium sp. rho-13.3]MDX8311744.1 glycosyltransferase [Agrobacterium sp. rho-13.3]